ncbi:hypothetical protein ACHQM5_014597 [Ranunculus cassubicifolius]
MEVSAIASLPKASSTYLSSHNSTFFNNGTTNLVLKSNNNCVVVSKRNRVQRSGRLKIKCLFGLGVPELAVIAGVAALVFGPKKLPEVGRSIGKTVKSFQQAAKEFESELKKEPEQIGASAVEPKPVSEEKKEDIKTPSTKESA